MYLLKKIKKFLFILTSLDIPNIDINAGWMQNAISVVGGNALNQLSEAWGMYIDDNQTIDEADSLNYRIVEWKKSV
jgi:hypothetical protein